MRHSQEIGTCKRGESREIGISNKRNKSWDMMVSVWHNWVSDTKQVRLIEFVKAIDKRN